MRLEWRYECEDCGALYTEPQKYCRICKAAATYIKERCRPDSSNEDGDVSKDKV